MQNSPLPMMNEILPQLGLVVYPTIYRVFAIPGGELAGFLPSFQSPGDENGNLEISKAPEISFTDNSSFFRSRILWIDLRLPCSFMGETDSRRFFFRRLQQTGRDFFGRIFPTLFFGEPNRWPLIGKETSTPSYCIST